MLTHGLVKYKLFVEMATQPKFDLDALLKINYEYEPLKKVLEYLLSRDKETADKLLKLGTDIDDNKKEIAM